MQKARRHHTRWLRPLVGAWFQELFHSPRRGAFHLSLTVLVHYRSHGSIQPCRMVPADSHRVSRAPRYSGYHYARACFGYGAVILCGATFQTLLLASTVRRRGPTTPGERLRTVPGLGWSPFARHYWGNHCCFLFLRVLRCFSSPRSPRRPNDAGDRPSGGRVVPFGNPGVNGHLLLTRAYRSLSRPSSPP